MIFQAFLNQSTRNSGSFLLAVKKKSPFRACLIARTVQLLRHDTHGPISAEISTIDSLQSDLRISL